MTKSCASKRQLIRYKTILRLLPQTDVKDGLVGKGLFTTAWVKKNGLIAEYTGNHVSGPNLERLYRELDYHGQDPNILVDLPSDNSVIDPRTVGKEGQFANHSCSPNARLVEVDVKGKGLVFICALIPLKTGEEVFIDYQWYSDMPGSPRRVPCLFRSANCRLAI